MQVPLATFKAKLTKGSIAGADGKIRGMPGYTFIYITAEMADGSRFPVADIYAPNIAIEHSDILGTSIAVYDEDNHYRGTHYVHSYEWMN